MMIRKKNGLSLCLITLTVAFWGCKLSVSSDSQSLPQQQGNVAQSKSNVQIDDAKLLPESIRESASTGLEDCWKQFMREGNYRIALPEDFSFPPQSSQVIEALDSRIKGPFRYFYRGVKDYNEYDPIDALALLVVDASKLEDKGLRMVIFQPSAQQKDQYEFHWVELNMSLSQSVLDTASGRLVIETYLGDYKKTACYVTWNNQKKSYTC